MNEMDATVVGKKIWGLIEHSKQLLSHEDLCEILDQGKEVAKGLLDDGKVALFPHVGLTRCGVQVASVVNACLDTGSDTILAIGVVHALTDEIHDLRQRQEEGKSLDNEPLRGIHFYDGVNPKWLHYEFCLDSFEYLLEIEAKRRKRKVPKVIRAFPFLVGISLDNLKGLDQLVSYYEKHPTVVTTDLVHHGFFYGDHQALEKEGAYEFAKDGVEKGLALASKGDLDAYYHHTLKTRSDGRDLGPILHYLLGSFGYQIIDFWLVDTNHIYEASSPHWVAATLASLNRQSPR